MPSASHRTRRARMGGSEPRHRRSGRQLAQATHACELIGNEIVGRLRSIH